MKRFLLALALLAFASVRAIAGVCDDPAQTRQSVPVNVSSATTTKLLQQLTAYQQIYVCNIALTAVATNPTVKFEYGTQVTNPCDTGTVVFTGTIAPLTGTFIAIGYGGDLLFLPQLINNQFCLVTGGTGSPSFQGIITYVVR